MQKILMTFSCPKYIDHNVFKDAVHSCSCPWSKGHGSVPFSFTVFYDIINHYLHNRPLIYAVLFITLLSLVGDIAYLDIQYQVRTRSSQDRNRLSAERSRQARKLNVGLNFTHQYFDDFFQQPFAQRAGRRRQRRGRAAPAHTAWYFANCTAAAGVPPL